MGFSKDKVQKIIPICLSFTVEDHLPDGTVTEEHALVQHNFRRPTPNQRAALETRITQLEARRKGSGAKTIDALYDFWCGVIISVEGYDDLDMEKLGDRWKLYFKDVIGLEHVQSAVIALHAKLGGTEEDAIVKKSF